MERIEADETASQREESLMNIIPALIPHDQAPHLTEPAHGALDDPSVSPQLLLRFNASAGNSRRNVPLPEGLSSPFGIVGFVGVEFAWTFTRAPNAR